MAEKDTVALRKRAQIAKANKAMFLWVALASVVVSVAAVLVIVMTQKLFHNQRAIGELNSTVATLRENNENVPELENQVRMLGSDPALLRLRTNDTDNALRVILDALPAEPNPSALGASLQSRLFGNITVESVQITPVFADEVAADAEEEGDTEETAGSGANAISFQFTVRGNSASLKELLDRLERSIRTIQVSNLRLEGSGNDQTLSVNGEAYFMPAKRLELKNMDIKP